MVLNIIEKTHCLKVQLTEIESGAQVMVLNMQRILSNKIFRERLEYVLKQDYSTAGGTGSFGKALTNKMLNKKYQIREIRNFSRDEKQDDMRKNFNNSKLKFYIGDVRDRESMYYAMQK